jgi:predicted RNase H-like nuclease (RuvC/YqgF family)
MILADAEISGWMVAGGAVVGALVSWIAYRADSVLKARKLAEELGERKGVVDHRLHTLEQDVSNLAATSDGGHLKATLEFLEREIKNLKDDFSQAVRQIFDKIDKLISDPNVEERKRKLVQLEVTQDNHAERLDLIEDTLRRCPSCANSLRRERHET